MASLNTLRTKGGWFLSGVIMIALLAFILNDAGSCRNNHNPVVGEINGVRINYTDFMHEMNRQNELLRLMGAGTEQSDEASDNAWTELIMRHSLIPGFSMLGITNTEKELIDMSTGDFLSPVLMNYFRNPETNVFDPNMLRYFVQEAGRDPARFALWQNIQKQMNDERLISKYGTLVVNAMKVTDLEVRSAMNAENNTFDARVIFKPYNSIPDSAVVITPAEIKEYFKAHQNRFRRTAARDIEFVVFDVLPSTDDLEAAQKRINELAGQFKVAENPATFASLNSPDDKTPAVFVRESEVETSIAAVVLADPNAMYGPVLNGETFTMARLAESRMIPDSVTLSMIAFPATEKALADSLMKIANGNNFAELARNYSQDANTARQGGEIGAIDPLLFTRQNPKIAEALIGATKGQIVRVEEGGVIFLLYVSDKSIPVKKVKIATLKYTVRPGSITHNNVMNQANEFYNSARGSYENFKKTANEAALPKRVARITAADRNVSGIENSIALVRWALESKAGTVREPEEFANSYVVVAVLTNVIEEGIAPLEEVTNEITALLRQRKKGEMIAQQLSGASLNAIAQEHNLEIHEPEGLSFSMFGLPGFVMEPRLIGAICSATETGRLSAPVKGNQGVFLFEVTNIVKGDEVSEADVRLRLESIGQYFLNELLMRALHEKSNIVDNRVKFF